MSKTIYHSHHIIPLHMGGTDDPSNLVELSVSDHAKAHFLLWLEHRRWEDRIAYLGLMGIIGHEEAVRLVLSEAGRKGAEAVAKKYTSADRSAWRKKAWDRATDEEREAHREAVSKGRTGIKIDPIHLPAMSERMSGENHPLFGVPWGEERLWITNGKENRRINPTKESLTDGWRWGKTVFNPSTKDFSGENNQFYNHKHKQSSKDLIGAANSGVGNGSLQKARANNILYQDPYLAEILEMRADGLGKVKIKRVMDQKFPELISVPKHQYLTVYQSVERHGL